MATTLFDFGSCSFGSFFVSYFSHTMENATVMTPETDQVSVLEAKNAFVFGNQHQDALTKKRSRTRLSVGAKMDAIYKSLDALNTIQTLLRAILSAT